jgi:hypothetical protein
MSFVLSSLNRQQLGSENTDNPMALNFSLVISMAMIKTGYGTEVQG